MAAIRLMVIAGYKPCHVRRKLGVVANRHLLLAQRFTQRPEAQAELCAAMATLSQLTQARETKRYVEHLRAHNDINKGVLFWQFNDCCPAITWSAIDSQKNPKALYYYARRFFAPVLLTLVARPDRQRPDLHPTLNAAKIVIINDSPDPITATLQCRLMDLAGNTIDKADFPVSLAPHTHSASLKLPRAITNPQKPDASLIELTLENHEEMIAQNTFTTLPDKYIDWPDADIKTKIEQVDSTKWNIILASDAVVRDLRITSSVPATLSDNYFDLIPQTTHRITVDFAQNINYPKKLLRFRSVRSEH